MDFSKFKNKEYVKSVGKSVLDDLFAEAQKLKDINTDTVLNGFKIYFAAYLKNNYYKYEGRLSRRTYWMFMLYSFLVCLLAGIIGLGTPAIVLLAVPFVCSAIRRLHDFNLTGKFVLIGLIPVLGGVCLLLLFSLSGDKSKNNFGIAEK